MDQGVKLISETVDNEPDENNDKKCIDYKRRFRTAQR
jgi:hypothetical protein